MQKWKIEWIVFSLLFFGLVVGLMGSVVGYLWAIAILLFWLAVIALFQFVAKKIAERFGEDGGRGVRK